MHDAVKLLAPTCAMPLCRCATMLLCLCAPMLFCLQRRCDMGVVIGTLQQQWILPLLPASLELPRIIKAPTHILFQWYFVHECIQGRYELRLACPDICFCTEKSPTLLSNEHFFCALGISALLWCNVEKPLAVHFGQGRHKNGRFIQLQLLPAAAQLRLAAFFYLQCHVRKDQNTSSQFIAWENAIVNKSSTQWDGLSWDRLIVIAINCNNKCTRN